MFEPLHSPLEDILLSFYNFDGLCRRECYVLTQKGEGTEIQTPHNRFQCITLKVLLMEFDLSFPANVEVEAKIRLKGPQEFTKILSSKNIALPIEHGDTKIQWCKLGTLEEKLLPQFGFRVQQEKTERTDIILQGFVIDQAYLSQPLPNSS